MFEFNWTDWQTQIHTHTDTNTGWPYWKFTKAQRQFFLFLIRFCSDRSITQTQKETLRSFSLCLHTIYIFAFGILKQANNNLHFVCFVRFLPIFLCIFWHCFYLSVFASALFIDYVLDCNNKIQLQYGSCTMNIFSCAFCILEPKSFFFDLVYSSNSTKFGCSFVIEWNWWKLQTVMNDIDDIVFYGFK